MRNTNALPTQQIKNIIIMWAPDLVIALIVCSLDDNKLSTFLWTWLVILPGISLFCWTKKSLSIWVVYWLGGRETIKNHIVEGWKLNHWPKPEEFADGESYLVSVAENSDVPVGIRRQATRDLGYLAFPTDARLVQIALRLTWAYNDAVNEYRKQFLYTEQNLEGD